MHHQLARLYYGGTQHSKLNELGGNVIMQARISGRIDERVGAGIS